MQIKPPMCIKIVCTPVLKAIKKPSCLREGFYSRCCILINGDHCHGGHHVHGRYHVRYLCRGLYI
jgi:hypothetical protein